MLQMETRLKLRKILSSITSGNKVLTNLSILNMVVNIIQENIK